MVPAAGYEGKGGEEKKTLKRMKPYHGDSLSRYDLLNRE